MRWMLMLCALLAGCTSYGVYRQPLMPAPALIAEGLVDPFDDGPHGDDHTVLYATDRDPAGPEHKERFYRYERGRMLRFGEAHVDVDVDGDGDPDWETLIEESLSGDRQHEYEMLVDEVTEYGV